jgi:hypothetical protein
MKVLTKRSVAMVGLALAVMCCAAAAPPQFGKPAGFSGSKGIALSGGGNGFNKGKNALGGAQGNPRNGANAVGGSKNNAPKRNLAGPRENTRAAASQERNKGNTRNVKSSPKRSEAAAQHAQSRPQQPRRPAESGQRLSTSPSGKHSSVQSAATLGNPSTKAQHVQRPTHLRPNDTHQRPTDPQAKRPVAANAQQANHANAVPRIHSVQKPNSAGLASNAVDARRPTAKTGTNDHPRPNQDDKNKTQAKSVSTKEGEKNRAPQFGTRDPKQQTALPGKREQYKALGLPASNPANPGIGHSQIPDKPVRPAKSALLSYTDQQNALINSLVSDPTKPLDLRNTVQATQDPTYLPSDAECSALRAGLGKYGPAYDSIFQKALSNAYELKQNQLVGQGGVLGDASSGCSSGSGGSQASQIAEGVLQIVGGAIGNLGSASGAGQAGSPMSEAEEGGWGTYQGSSRGTTSAASGSGRGRGRVVPVSTFSQVALPVRTGTQPREIASTDADLEATAPTANRQTTRYLRVVNTSGEKVTVFLRYYTQDQSQAWNWFPGAPGDESAEPLAFEFEPGEAADLTDNEWRVNASRVRLWGQAASGKQWPKFKDQDFLLVPEVDEDGRHSYPADGIGVCSFTIK